jgi:GNAT superfamily N-acetyltransferase
VPVDPPLLRLGPLPSSALGELLTLQRAAYVTEAQLYDDVGLPALVQTLDELIEEAGRSRCLGAWSGPRLVGAVRGEERDAVLHIGRLVVAPDLQGRGIGSRLLTAIEAATDLAEATLFTGARSEANLRLYRRHGYAESRREQLHPGVELVHLTKSLR